MPNKWVKDVKDLGLRATGQEHQDRLGCLLTTRDLDHIAEGLPVAEILAKRPPLDSESFVGAIENAPAGRVVDLVGKAAEFAKSSPAGLVICGVAVVCVAGAGVWFALKRDEQRREEQRAAERKAPAGVAEAQAKLDRLSEQFDRTTTVYSTKMKEVSANIAKLKAYLEASRVSAHRLETRLDALRKWLDDADPETLAALRKELAMTPAARARAPTPGRPPKKGEERLFDD